MKWIVYTEVCFIVLIDWDHFSRHIFI